MSVTDPLQALSLARTALSDPEALPSTIDFDSDLSMAGESADAVQVAYAVTQIDDAIGGLYFEPFDDPARAAAVTLANVDRLVSAVADGLDESVGFEGAVVEIREAVAHLTGARVLLASTRS